MNEVLYAGALGLAAVFAWAGAAKAVAPQRTRRTFAALGLPAALATVVPAVELALSAGLVVAPGTVALAALAMLVAFTALLGRVVARGEAVACGCFGSARPEPVSVVDLVRNGILIAVAAAVALGGTTAATPGLAAVITASGLAAVALLVVALADLKRRTGSIVGVPLGRRASEERASEERASDMSTATSERRRSEEMSVTGRPTEESGR